jgi:hypothetical protein
VVSANKVGRVCYLRLAMIAAVLHTAVVSRAQEPEEARVAPPGPGGWELLIPLSISRADAVAEHRMTAPKFRCIVRWRTVGVSRSGTAACRKGPGQL